MARSMAALSHTVPRAWLDHALQSAHQLAAPEAGAADAGEASSAPTSLDVTTVADLLWALRACRYEFSDASAASDALQLLLPASAASLGAAPPSVLGQVAVAAAGWNLKPGGRALCKKHEAPCGLLPVEYAIPRGAHAGAALCISQARCGWRHSVSARQPPWQPGALPPLWHASRHCGGGRQTRLLVTLMAASQGCSSRCWMHLLLRWGTCGGAPAVREAACVGGAGWRPCASTNRQNASSC